MIYNSKNCAYRAVVYDVDTKQKIKMVEQVDTEAMILSTWTPQFAPHGGEFAFNVIQYTSIYPIFGGSPWPVMFHCYGRIE